MRAAVLRNPGDIVIKDIPRPTIKETEILLEVEVCSICGTDRKIYEKGHEKIAGRQILGHELAGEIVEVGREVEYFKPGMKITMPPYLGCGHCRYCLRGLNHLCVDVRHYGVDLPGGFAEYFKIDQKAINQGSIVEIPEDMSFSTGALVEPLACCFNAYQSLDIAPDENLLIFGAGSMGNINLLLNKILGTREIIMVDIDKLRLSFSKELKADYVVNNQNEDLSQKIERITRGKGVDNLITAVPSAEVQKQALDLLSVKGSINFFAGLSQDEEIFVNTNNIHYNQYKLTGTSDSSVKQFRQSMDIASGRPGTIKKIITEKVRLKDLESIFDDENFFRKNLKIQVDMS